MIYISQFQEMRTQTKKQQRFENYHPDVKTLITKNKRAHLA